MRALFHCFSLVLAEEAKNAAAIGYLLTNERTPFTLTDPATASRKKKWNAWAVPRHLRRRADELFTRASDMVNKRNNASLENSLDRLTLRKAHILITSSQLRPMRRELYSIRSPSTLPFKVLLWIDKGSTEIMARKNGQSVSLKTFLERYRAMPLDDDRLNKLWQAWVFNAEVLKLQKLPRSSYEDLMGRWSRQKGFRFLDMPGELRNKVYGFAMMGRYQRHYRVPSSWPRFAEFSNRNLFHVNEQVRRETSAIIWASTTACFKPHPNLKRCPVQSLLLRQDCLRSVEISADLPRLLYFFGAPVHPDWRPGIAPASALRNQSNLQHIRIRDCGSPRFTPKAPRVAGCQRIVCGWIFAAAEDNIKHIPFIEVMDFIDREQTVAFMKGIELERRGLTDGSEEIIDWETTQWVW